MTYPQKSTRFSGVSTLLLCTVALTSWGCASAPTPGPQPAAVDSAEESAASAVEPDDPFGVAARWATELVDPARTSDASRNAAVSEEIAAITASWTTAQVARIWAVGPEYRALITQRSTTEQRPAVLLHISADPGGAWRVSGLSPATSTYLWSHF